MSHPLTRVPGRRIRHQFMPLIFWSLVVAIAATLLLEFRNIRQAGETEAALAQYANTCLVCLTILGIVGGLTLLNRFRIGRTVAVLAEDALHTPTGTIPWAEITRMEYDVMVSGEDRARLGLPRRSRASVVRVYTKKGGSLIEKAPLHLLRAAKKYASHIETSIAPRTRILLCVLIPVFAILAVILAVQLLCF